METLVTTLEQSKALVTAGIKGEGVFWWVENWDSDEPDGKHWFCINTGAMQNKAIHFPAYTLSELIFMCGEAFDSLWLPPEGVDGAIVWCARPKWDWRKFITGEFVQGSTPIEAVTNLLLAINK